MSRVVAAYQGMPAAERLDLRVPAALKAHIQQAAERAGQSASEYLIALIAEQVTRDLAEASEWHLTIPEQEVLLRAITSPAGPTPAARKAAQRAESLFGSAARPKRKR